MLKHNNEWAYFTSLRIGYHSVFSGYNFVGLYLYFPLTPVFSPYKPHLSKSREHLISGYVTVPVLVITSKGLSDLLLVLVFIVQFLFEDLPMVQELLHAQTVVTVVLTGSDELLHMRTL